MVNESVWRSALLFALMTLKHWGLLVSGAVVSLIGWSLNVFGVQTVPIRYFLLAIALTVLIAMCHAFHDVRLRRDVLEEERKPKFEIVFLPDNDDESRPYVQMLTFPQRRQHPTHNGPLDVTMCDRRYRVGVRNLSSAVVPKVQVILVKSDPGTNWIHPGHRLLVMDSDPPEGERDLPTSPSGDPTLFFDVVQETAEQGRVSNHIAFCFANPNLGQPILDADEYRIVLRAEGGGWSDERSFVVTKRWDAERRKRHRVEMMPV